MEFIISRVRSYRDIEIELSLPDLISLAKCPTVDWEIDACAHQHDCGIVTIRHIDRLGELTIRTKRELRLSANRLLELARAEMENPRVTGAVVRIVNGAPIGVRITVQEVER
jgi:hypothetical protein